MIGRKVHAELTRLADSPLQVQLQTRQRMNRKVFAELRKIRRVRRARVISAHQYVIESQRGVTMDELDAQIKAAFRTLRLELEVTYTLSQPSGRR